MKFTYSWLKRFLDTNKSKTELVKNLTMLGFEVEKIIDRSQELKNFEVAEIISVKPLDYNNRIMQSITKTINYWYRAMESVVTKNISRELITENFLSALLDDMNTPLAIKLINDYAKLVFIGVEYCIVFKRELTIIDFDALNILSASFTDKL